MTLPCDVVCLQFWKKSDDHTESRQYRTNHSQDTTSVSCVITYELLNLVQCVPCLFDMVLSLISMVVRLYFMYISLLQTLAVSRYLRCSSLHLFLQQTVQSSSLRSLQLISIPILPLLHHADALHHLSSHVLTVLLPVNVMLHTHRNITLLLLVGPSSHCAPRSSTPSPGNGPLLAQLMQSRHGIGFPSSG